MIVKMDTDAVLDKMTEVCALLLEQPAYQEFRAMIDTFAEDVDAVRQYEAFIDQHERLQSRERQGIGLSAEEVSDYEQAERSLYENEVIRQFLQAQREFSSLHNKVSQYFIKAVELNRLPTPRDLEKDACGCGGSCGCGGEH